MTHSELKPDRYVASLCEVSPRTVRKWCRDGTLEGVQRGKQWMVWWPPRACLNPLDSPPVRRP